jgi:hypothetical protein
VSTVKIIRTLLPTVAIVFAGFLVAKRAVITGLALAAAAGVLARGDCPRCSA